MQKELFPNILLVAGDGRNVGKTYWCCRCIEHLSSKSEVVGVKISPHFHYYDANNLIVKTDDYVIIRETNINNKDSSLMLQAGAGKVYFVMCKRDKIGEAFESLKSLFDNKVVVVESGGLHKVISPGLFFYIIDKGKKIGKKEYLDYNPILINNDGEQMDFDIQNIRLHGNELFLDK